MGASGNMSEGTSVSGSTGSSADRTFVDPSQQPWLDALRGGAFGIADPTGQQGAVGEAVGRVNEGIGAGMDALQGMLNPQAQIDAQVGGLQSGLGQLFREELNPAITSNAIAAGGLGGSRQGVAQGQAVGQIGQAFTQGYGDIVARANANAQNAAMGLGSLGGQYIGNAMQPGLAGLDIYARLAQILGGPTILGEGGSASSSFGESQNTGEGFGFNIIPF